MKTPLHPDVSHRQGFFGNSVVDYRGSYFNTVIGDRGMWVATFSRRGA